jgi:hypothetical protein
MLSASAGLALCLLLLGGADPARAHQDCADTAFSQTYENAPSCVACKRALRPSRALISRADGTDVAATPPAQRWTVAQALAVSPRWVAGRLQAHIRATGVMRVGNVVLLN